MYVHIERIGPQRVVNGHPESQLRGRLPLVLVYTYWMSVCLGRLRICPGAPEHRRGRVDTAGRATRPAPEAELLKGTATSDSF